MPQQISAGGFACNILSKNIEELKDKYLFGPAANNNAEALLGNRLNNIPLGLICQILEGIILAGKEAVSVTTRSNYLE